MSFQAISDTIDNALASAGIDPYSGRLTGVAQTIRSALARAGFPPPTARSDDARGGAVRTRQPVTGRNLPGAARAPARRAAAAAEAGRFLKRSFTNAAGTRAYKLYVPTSYRAAPMPLLMMLHGCKQSPDDFAAGTRMNELAEEHGFLVAYPAQSARANGANCWNWFQSRDQARDGGEPSILAGIVDDIATLYATDRRRVFVAGLSAGAAMAVILGQTYPEVFAAVGAHSGLPYRAARNVASAFAAMQGGPMPATLGGPPPTPAAKPAGATSTPGVPTVVFHGDRDHTVALSNADAIVEQALASGTPGLLEKKEVEPATAESRGYTRTVYRTHVGRPQVEHWVLHAGSHAWSGGSPNGSYTEAKGPDASAEMVRFFLSQ